MQPRSFLSLPMRHVTNRGLEDDENELLEELLLRSVRTY